MSLHFDQASEKPHFEKASFRIKANALIGMSGGNGDPSPGPYWDKVPSKFLG